MAAVSPESPARLHSQLLAGDAGSILRVGCHVAPILPPRRLRMSRSTADTALVAVLVGYMWPTTKFARWAVTIGGAAVYIVSSTKTVSFAISAVVSRTSFDFGNNSGTNSDIWSYTCTDQAATNNAVIQAESNCTTQVSTVRRVVW